MRVDLGRGDLVRVRSRCERMVAGYEVLLAHYRRSQEKLAEEKLLSASLDKDVARIAEERDMAREDLAAAEAERDRMKVVGDMIMGAISGSTGPLTYAAVVEAFDELEARLAKAEAIIREHLEHSADGVLLCTRNSERRTRGGTASGAGSNVANERFRSRRRTMNDNWLFLGIMALGVLQYWIWAKHVRED